RRMNYFSLFITFTLNSCSPDLNMVQSCGVKPPFDLTAVTLECKHGSKNLHIRRSQGDNPDDQDPMFKGRTSLIPQGNRTFTVTLTNVTKQDEGNYMVLFLFTC
uniref:Immunoglobulin V-set domain-containing protein n=1 Tax=Oryzias latipes TaxID=8090 RepID=A0A3P9LHN3_ORYLA